MKSSIFNYITECDEKTILYNTFTGKIASTTKQNDVKRILSGEESEDNQLKKNIIEDGFIVSDDEDEYAKGLLKYYDKVFNKSLSLTFLTTEQCNFRCKYCYENFSKGKMKSEVVDGVIKYLQKNLYSYSGLTIDWFGGEPLLAMDVIEKISLNAIELCRKLKKPYISGITTNGYLLDLETFKMLLKCKVFGYQITIDGMKEYHDKYRVLANGGKTFDRIISNLCAIRDNVKSSYFKISIRSNITAESLQRIDEYIDFLYKEFGNDSRFELFFRPVGDWGGERVHQISSNLVQSMNSVYEKLLKNKEISLFASKAYHSLLETGVCYAAIRNNFVIGSDGMIYKCTVAFEKEDNQVGKVKDNGVFEINYGKLAKWITPAKVKTQCNQCFSFHKCMGGQCAGQRFSDSQELRCGYEIEDIDNVLKLISNNLGHRQGY